MEKTDGAHKDERSSSYKINTALIRWQPIWLLSEISEYINKFDNTLNGTGYFTNNLQAALRASYFPFLNHWVIFQGFSPTSFTQNFDHYLIHISKFSNRGRNYHRWINQRQTGFDRITSFLDIFFLLTSIETPFISNLQTATIIFKLWKNKLSSSLWKRAKFFDYWTDTIFHSSGYACY